VSVCVSLCASLCIYVFVCFIVWRGRYESASVHVYFRTQARRIDIAVPELPVGVQKCIKVRRSACVVSVDYLTNDHPQARCGAGVVVLGVCACVSSTVYVFHECMCVFLMCVRESECVTRRIVVCSWMYEKWHACVRMLKISGRHRSAYCAWFVD